MKTILYMTGLWDRQAYCQGERIEAFNEVQKEAEKIGCTIKVHTVINNSSNSFVRQLERLHRMAAEFDYNITDIGHVDYEINEDGKHYFDIYRLLAEIFNGGMDLATKEGWDYYSIQSGDQILPANQASVFPTFLDVHQNCGLVNGLVYFDYCKTKTEDGRPAYRPMVSMENEEQQAWMMANLLPNDEHGGLDYLSVHRIGTGGSMMPRRVFEKLRFHTEFNGVGEDLRFCDELRDQLGMKIYVIPWIHIPNRYPNGEFY